MQRGQFLGLIPVRVHHQTLVTASLFDALFHPGAGSPRVSVPLEMLVRQTIPQIDLLLRVEVDPVVDLQELGELRVIHVRSDHVVRPTVDAVQVRGVGADPSIPVHDGQRHEHLGARNVLEEGVPPLVVVGEIDVVHHEGAGDSGAELLLRVSSALEQHELRVDQSFRVPTGQQIEIVPVIPGNQRLDELTVLHQVAPVRNPEHLHETAVRGPVAIEHEGYRIVLAVAVRVVVQEPPQHAFVPIQRRMGGIKVVLPPGVRRFRLVVDDRAGLREHVERAIGNHADLLQPVHAELRRVIDSPATHHAPHGGGEVLVVHAGHQVVVPAPREVLVEPPGVLGRVLPKGRLRNRPGHPVGIQAVSVRCAPVRHVRKVAGGDQESELVGLTPQDVHGDDLHVEHVLNLLLRPAIVDDLLVPSSAKPRERHLLCRHLLLRGCEQPACGDEQKEDDGEHCELLLHSFASSIPVGINETQ